MASSGFAGSSRLLEKQSELKIALAEYERLKTTYTPNVLTTGPSNYTNISNKNAISNVNPPPGISPGEDFGQYWKSITDNSATKTVDTCITAASYDPRVFKKVVYTGDANTSTDWNKKCYALLYNAPSDAVYDTTATGYTTTTPNIGYTKLGIANADIPTKTRNEEQAAKIYDLENRINLLTQDIIAIAPSAIGTSLSDLTKGVTAASELNAKISEFMNTGANDICNNLITIEKRQNRINVYDDINSQIHLKIHKYRFFIYFIIALLLVIGLLSYLSNLTITEQIESITSLIKGTWWANWSVVTFVIVLLILSSFGWDMRGNIMMIYRYITDIRFWTGELWWIGITFLLLIVIYLYRTFKTFFTSITPDSMKDLSL